MNVLRIDAAMDMDYSLSNQDEEDSVATLDDISDMISSSVSSSHLYPSALVPYIY